MFKADRSLINPKFEGYKLDPIEQEDHVFSYPLPRQVSQTTVSTSSTRAHLAFEDMRSRIRHNYLSIGQNGEALYVDDGMGVNILRINGGQPSFKRVCELPMEIRTDEVKDKSSAMDPSAVCIGKDIWLVSSGSGQLYLLARNEDSSEDDPEYRIGGSFEFLPIEEDDIPLPFTIHTAFVRQNDVLVLLTSKPPVNLDIKPKDKSILYQLHATSIPLPTAGGSHESAPIMALKSVWTLQGRDLPLSAEYSEIHRAFLVLASAQWAPTSSSPEPSEYTPKPDEMAPIPQPNEDLNKTNANILNTPQPPPYSWTQTSDSVTVAFPLPATISTREIHVQLARKAATILVKQSQPLSALLTSSLPRYALKELWGEIKVGESLWTWDQTDDHSFGLLTLHLEKGHEGTRWPHVFVSEELEGEVAETVDPSELAKIRDLLEKYTSGHGDFGAGAGLGQGVPSLAEGEADEELDSNVGRSIIPTWIDESGKILGSARDRTPFIVLSTPMPSSSHRKSTASSPSVTVKQAVDGLLLSPELKPDSPPESGLAPEWKHTDTYSALSFVLASKRDVKFTFHTDSAVLAFESGASGNVYIYRQIPKNQDPRWAKQAILKVSGGTAGSLLGAGLLYEDGKKYVLVLCERELKVIRGAI